MPFSKEQLAAHRVKLKAKGICVRCHKRETPADRVTCTQCGKDRYEYSIGKRIQARKDGMCRECFCRPAVNRSQKLCERCRQRSIMRTRERRSRWVVDPTKCNGCGHTLGEFNELSGRKQCENCVGSKANNAITRTMGV